MISEDKIQNSRVWGKTGGKMKIKKEYERWLANAVADTDVAVELKAMDYVEVEDAFYRDLAFGTGGLRGVIGARLLRD